MPIDEQIKQLEWELDQIKKKVRSDKGVNRVKYDSTLPKKHIRYLKGAASRGLEFKLNAEQTTHLFNMPCIYCDESISNGIDRIDSNIGYIEGNVQPCCYNCNMMKRSMTHTQFINHILKIARNVK
jgi:hypothetical protein